MVTRRQLVLFTVTGLFAVSALAPVGAGAPSQPKKKPAGETFSARAKVNTAGAGADAYLTIQIDKYTPTSDLVAMQDALKAGGSAAFVAALRKAPVVGHIKVGEQTFAIRWARQAPGGANSRVVSIVTDAPVYFVGAGVPGAKPRAGFDVAVVQLNVDNSGIGNGTMAAAAKVKPGGESGVEVEDYAAEPLKLVVSKVIS